MTDWPIAKHSASTCIEPVFTNPRGCKLCLRPITRSALLAYSTVCDWLNLRPSALEQVMIEAEPPSGSGRQSWNTGFKARMDPTRHHYTVLKLDLQWIQFDGMHLPA